VSAEDEVREVPAIEVDGDEGWDRLTDEPQVRGVEAIRHSGHAPWRWSLSVWAMEFVREEPLESELRIAIAAALRAVDRVTDVAEEDRELWVISGTPSGRELVLAVASVLDQFATRVRDHLDSFDE
jgi:hypothetical protein